MAFDAGYDLSAFMEGFPGLMCAVASGHQFELDLYPQGMERDMLAKLGTDFVQALDAVDRHLSGMEPFAH